MLLRNEKILFTAPCVAELQSEVLEAEPTEGQALVQTLYTAISAGTERANLRGEHNLLSDRMEDPPYPRHFGYSGVARVLKTGAHCSRVKAGDRVIVYFGNHSSYNVFPEEKLFPIRYESINDQQAALLVIAGFPAEGVRKAGVEFGESVLVMGLGILGLIGVQLARVAGAVPVIAADPNPKRRQLALQLGADAALDPLQTDFQQQLLALTDGKGVNIAVDAAGNANATVQAMQALAKFGRITLLGCTRMPGTYDLYHLVHGKGVHVIGANNFARPTFESQPRNWTAEDDLFALQKLLHGGRLNLQPFISEVHSPADAVAVYDRLLHDRDFPIGVLFDWCRTEG